MPKFTFVKGVLLATPAILATMAGMEWLNNNYGRDGVLIAAAGMLMSLMALMTWLEER